MRENPALFFGARWFCPEGTRDIGAIAAEYADPADNDPMAIRLQALYKSD